MSKGRPSGSGTTPAPQADQLFKAYRTGAVSASLAVHLLDDKQNKVVSISLTNARLTRYTQYVEGGVLTEEVSIGYNDIKVETENTGGGGTTT